MGPISSCFLLKVKIEYNTIKSERSDIAVLLLMHQQRLCRMKINILSITLFQRRTVVKYISEELIVFLIGDIHISQVQREQSMAQCSFSSSIQAKKPAEESKYPEISRQSSLHNSLFINFPYV